MEEDNKKEISFFIPENDEDVCEDGTYYIKLYDVKMNGARWRFHKNDPDPFPSKPHGHNVNTGEKLNIWNGEVYNKNKILINKFSKKKILFVQARLRKVNLI